MTFTSQQDIKEDFYGRCDGGKIDCYLITLYRNNCDYVAIKIQCYHHCSSLNRKAYDRINENYGVVPPFVC